MGWFENRGRERERERERGRERGGGREEARGIGERIKGA